MAKFIVGTSGWSYSDWKGLFYPKNVSSPHYLEYYSTVFSAVELNSSFYRLPTPNSVKTWIEKTPDTFYFCPKLSKLITHNKRLKNCSDLLKEYIKLFKPMKPKLGPFLIQLPPSLKFEHEHESFFSLLQKQYADYLFSLEARHETWMNLDVLNLLASYNIGWVIADSGGHFPALRAATTQTVYFRFHGPKSLFASNYSARQLKVYVANAKEALKEGRDVWVFFNNDFHGYAIRNAQLFKALVESE